MFTIIIFQTNFLLLGMLNTIGATDANLDADMQ